MQRWWEIARSWHLSSGDEEGIGQRLRWAFLVCAFTVVGLGDDSSRESLKMSVAMAMGISSCSYYSKLPRDL